MSDVSSPEAQMVSDYLASRTIKSKGVTKVFVCRHCRYRHHGKKIVKVHKRICKKRDKKQKKKPILIREAGQNPPQRKALVQTIQQQIIKRMIEPKHLENNDLIENLQKRVEQLEIFNKQTYGPLIKELFIKQSVASLSASIMKNTKDHVNQLLQSKIRTLLENALINGIKIHQSTSAFQSRYLAKMYELDLQGLIYSIREKLDDAHALIQNKSKGKTKKTLSNNEKAKKFLQNYRQFQLKHQAKLIKHLLTLSPGNRNNIRRYFNLLRKYPDFVCFPSIPALDPEQKWKEPRHSIQVQEIALKVNELMASNRAILATDIWVCACLGLRSNDLQTVFFVKNKEYVCSIKILERKNKNQTCRYVPSSLIGLIKKSQVQYPMGSKRLKQTRQYCLNNFRCFYSFRHSCITKIVECLHKSSAYGQFHKKPSTTQMYYLDEKSKSFLDEVFKLDEQQEHFYDRKLLLDLTGVRPRFLDIQGEGISVSIQPINMVMQGYQQDNIMLGEVSQNQILQGSGPQDEKLQVISKMYVFNNYQRELDSALTTHLIHLISDATEDNNLIDIVEDKLAALGSINDEEMLLDAVEEVTKCSIIYIHFDGAGNRPEIKQIGVVQNKKPLMIAVEKNKYRQAKDIQIKLLPELRSIGKQISLWKMNINLPLLSNAPPSCKSCKKKSLDIQNREEQEIVLKCKNCEWQINLPFVKSPINKKGIKIHCHYSCKIDDQNYVGLGISQRKNNLQELVKNQLKDSFITESLYSSQFPNEIVTSYRSFSDKMSLQIQNNRKNYDKLPLTLEKSSLSEWGVFATVLIPADTIIMTYCGVICTSLSVNSKSGFLYHLGWLNLPHPCEVFISHDYRANAARYIKGGERKHEVNCKTIVGVYKNQEIVICIVSTKSISAGEELVNNYGNIHKAICLNKMKENHIQYREQIEEQIEQDDAEECEESQM